MSWVSWLSSWIGTRKAAQRATSLGVLKYPTYSGDREYELRAELAGLRARLDVMTRTIDNSARTPSRYVRDRDAIAERVGRLEFNLPLPTPPAPEAGPDPAGNPFDAASFPVAHDLYEQKKAEWQGAYAAARSRCLHRLNFDLGSGLMRCLACGEVTAAPSGVPWVSGIPVPDKNKAGDKSG